MALSQIDQQQEQSPVGEVYTHKKFNCGYSHKKLGLRLSPRMQDNKENLMQQQEQQQLKAKQQVSQNKSTKAALFRPYALHDNTPRKRRMSRSMEINEENVIAHLPYTTQIATSQKKYCMNIPQVSPPNKCNNQQQDYIEPLAVVTSPPPASVQYSNSPTLSPNSYTLRLQRQRAAMYMHYLAQFQQLPAAAVLQAAAGYSTSFPVSYPMAYPMGYPNVTAPIYNGC